MSTPLRSMLNPEHALPLKDSSYRFDTILGSAIWLSTRHQS